MTSQTFDKLYRKATDAFDQERIVLLTFVLWATFSLVETFDFRIASAARFPRLTGSAVLVGGLLLIFRDYLPGPIHAFVAESVEVLQTDEDAISKQQEYDEEREAGADEEAAESEFSTVGRPIHDSVFAALLMMVYAILGYAIGIFWATPIFVVAYGVWFKQDYKRILMLTIIGVLIAYGFMSALGIPLDRGELVFTEGVF